MDDQTPISSGNAVGESGVSSEILLVQISRGLAPVPAIVGAVQAAYYYQWEYQAVVGLPLVEAKNRAAQLALERGAHLILLEDDIVVDRSVWEALLALGPETVGYGRARMRDGNDNVYYNDDGEFTYSGNCLVWVPCNILRALPRPIFSAARWNREQDTLGGLQGNGVGSDTVFWYHIRQLDPAPPIVEVGTVKHLKHALNVRRDNLTPCEITTW